MSQHGDSQDRGGSALRAATATIAIGLLATDYQGWAVIEGSDDFFHVTKRSHNDLHGVAGGGGDLGEASRGST